MDGGLNGISRCSDLNQMLSVEYLTDVSLLIISFLDWIQINVKEINLQDYKSLRYREFKHLLIVYNDKFEPDERYSSIRIAQIQAGTFYLAKQAYIKSSRK
jgi:hypothetical protein